MLGCVRTKIVKKSSRQLIETMQQDCWFSTRGISVKLQEKERERRMDFVADESAIRTEWG